MVKRQNPVDGEDTERHDKWLCMMLPRLQLMKELLAQNGVIFISIDYNEQANLKLLMGEIFNEENFINNCIWISNLKGRQMGCKGTTNTHEYILCYVKDIEHAPRFHGSIKDFKQNFPAVYQNHDYEIREDEKSQFIIKNELWNTNRSFNEETRPNLVYNIYYRLSLLITLFGTMLKFPN